MEELPLGSRSTLALALIHSGQGIQDGLPPVVGHGVLDHTTVAQDREIREHLHREVGPVSLLELESK